MLEIATRTVWSYSSWLEMQLVCFRSLDQDNPQNNNATLGSLILIFVKDGTPEPIASSICFLFVVSRAVPVFQHIVHSVVLDLLLYGWIELVFSLPVTSDVHKYFLCALSWQHWWTEANNISASLLGSVLANLHLKVNLQRGVT